MILPIFESAFKLFVCCSSFFIIFLLIKTFESSLAGIFGIGQAKFKIIKTPFADFFKLLSREDNFYIYKDKKKHIISKGYTTFLCIFVSLLPFCTFPIFKKISLNGNIYFSEYYYSEVALLFVLMSQIFIYPAIVVIVKNSNTEIQSVVLIRDFINFIISKAATVFILLPPILLYDGLDFHTIVQKQNGTLFGFLPAYGIFMAPISGILFFINLQLESSYGPFDTSRGGSGFSINKYDNLNGFEMILFKIVSGAQWFSLIILFVFMFMGGYSILPGLQYIVDIIPTMVYVMQLLSLFIKILFVIFFMTLIKRSLPVHSATDVASICFRKIIPLAWVNILGTIIYLIFKRDF